MWREEAKPSRFRPPKALRPTINPQFLIYTKFRRLLLLNVCAADGVWVVESPRERREKRAEKKIWGDRLAPALLAVGATLPVFPCASLANTVSHYNVGLVGALLMNSHGRWQE